MICSHGLILSVIVSNKSNARRGLSALFLLKVNAGALCQLPNKFPDSRLEEGFKAAAVFPLPALPINEIESRINTTISMAPRITPASALILIPKKVRPKTITAKIIDQTAQPFGPNER
jgi:hypothetical protein